VPDLQAAHPQTQEAQEGEEMTERDETMAKAFDTYAVEASAIAKRMSGNNGAVYYDGVAWAFRQAASELRGDGPSGEMKIV